MSDSRMERAHVYPLEPLLGRVISPFERFLRRTTAGGIILLFATAIALGLALILGGDAIHRFWETPFALSGGERFRLELTLQHWVNDGLMAFFFLLVGLELKREVLVGELSSIQDAALPLAAALGGMVVPALIYAALNANTPTASGWGIPPICVTIAAHATHAVGVAYAMKLRREARAAVCALGDGASSKGDFYESLNAAGVWNLPLVFIVTDNQWAISVPRARQSGAQTLAQKAIAAGIEGVQVDGNDVIAVRHAMERALAKARGGGGPTLVEALTYRLSDHTTADDASRYRSADEVAAAWKREPVLRLRTYLMSQDVWSREKEEGLLKECNEQVQAAAQAYLDTPAPGVDQIFSHVYGRLPAVLEKQRDDALGAS